MKHKDYYDDSYVQIIAGKINKIHAGFKYDKFISELEEKLDSLELFARFDLIVSALEKSMPDTYTENISYFFDLLEDELKSDSGMFNEGWWYWPVSRYVEKNGTLDFDISMKFIKELTKRFTGEFAVRPLINKFPKEAMEILAEWSKDDNVHVRRLASEGIRIRLPWSKKLTVALDEFEIYETILSNLKNDPSKFVQKSVGNNLNDLFKEAPDKAENIINKWRNDNPSKVTLWIIKHGTRSLKQNK